MVNDDRPEYQSRPELRSHSSFPQLKTIGDKPKGPLEKALSYFADYFADVRVGEAPGVLLLFAYYLVKTARESLVLAEGGAYSNAYSAVGQAALLMLLLPLHALIA